MKMGERTIQKDTPDSAWLTVHEGNSLAISFYQRLGYVSIGNDYHDFEHIRVNFNLMKKNCRT